MTRKKPISLVQPIWSNSQGVDDTDLTALQSFDNNTINALINNQIGTGTLSDSLSNKTLFDSLLVAGFLDGKKIETQSQPTDTNLGNLLEVELSGSKVGGKKTVKVCIIGLDFNGNLQYDTFVFKINEKQYTKKHYTNILAIFFNDLIGSTTQSFNLGGRVVIKETNQFAISRDTVMVSQDAEPNLFFRDFFVENNLSLNYLLQSALPLYNIDNLGISVGYKENKILAKNDVSSHIGQKFLTSTNNIQKITVLLSVQNTDPGMASDLDWHGDLVISIYPLQSTVNCITDLVPELAIDFSPSNIPIAQLSVNFSSLQAQGVVLDGTPQPVDFVFSNTPVAANGILPNSYYVFTLKRSGSADKCDILITSGSNKLDNSRLTTFTGTAWVDIPEDDLWFKIYTDAVKITDGQAYDETGQGIAISKTKLDTLTGLTKDNSLDAIYFTGGDTFTATLSSTVEKSELIQDQRTGDPVYSRQQYVPDVKLLNSIDIQTLRGASEPLIIGQVVDKNKKSLDAVNATLLAALHGWTFIKNKVLFKIIDDITDPRYDANVNALVSELLNGNLINAKLIPNVNVPTIFYRVAEARLCSMMYGDINGDGIVDIDDVSVLNDLLTSDLTSSPPLNSQITTDGYTTTTVVNGYYTYINEFKNDNVVFQIINDLTNTIVATGSDGVLVADPNDPSRATFQSLSTNFNLITNLANYKLVIYNSLNSGNNGSFIIESTNSNNVIAIRKIYYTSEIIKQVFRADIDNNFIVNNTDGYLISNYVNKVAPFPSHSLPASRVGTSFNVIELTVEPFVYSDVPANLIIDRTDDFTADTITRATTLHPLQDIFVDGYSDGYLQSNNFLTTPISLNLVKQFTWEDYLVIANGNSRLVPTVFTNQSGAGKNSCTLDGITCELYSDPSTFDPGTVDLFVPHNLILDGNIVNTDGSAYKVDFEIGTIVLNIPDGYFANEKTINIFDDFVSNYNNSGLTRLGFKAMRFADCSFVNSSSLLNNQVRFNVAVQSFSPLLNGTDADGYEGVIVDPRIGVSMNYSTGLLTINFNNLYQDSVLQTLSTKIQITVYLKKAGFNNTPLFVDSDKVSNLLALTSNFTGAGTGFAAQEINPLYINGFTGVASISTNTPTAIGALSFKFSEILPGYSSIILEAILETDNASNAAELRLYDLTGASYIQLDTSAIPLTTTSTTAVMVRSVDLSALLEASNQDFVYEIRLSLALALAGNTAKCKFVRLVVYY